MNPNYTRRLVGGAAALLGLWWVWSSTFPFVRELWNDDRETGLIFFFLTIVPLMAIPGVLAVIFGVRLFSSMSVSSLKWVVGLFAVFGAFWLSACLSSLFPKLLPESISITAFLFLSSLAAIPAYLFTVRKLLSHLTEQVPSFTSLISRGILALMAWQLWLLLFSVFDEHSPIKEGYTHIHEEPWDTLGILVPIIVAYGSYRIFVALLTKAHQGAAEHPATGNAAS